jgi:hypothetical protein
MRVDGDRILISEKKPLNNCSCKPKRQPSPGEQFCSKCGQEFGRSVTYRSVAKKFPFTRENLLEDEMQLDGYQVFTDREFKYFYFAIVPPARPFNVREDYDVMAPLPIFTVEQVQKFSSVMVKYGIYDPKRLGVWTVVRYS